MKKWYQTATFLVFSLPLTACSVGHQGSSTANLSTSDALSGTSTALYADVLKLSASQKQQVFSNLGSMTFSELYDHVHSQLSNDPITVDGVAFNNVLRQFEASRPAILALGSRYKNLQALWTSLGISPATMSDADVKAGFASLLGKSTSGLALSGDSECSSFESRFGATSVALAGGLNTTQTMAAEFNKDSVYPIRGADSLYAVTLADATNFFSTTSDQPQNSIVPDSQGYISQCLDKNDDGSYSPAKHPSSDAHPNAHDPGFVGP